MKSGSKYWVAFLVSVILVSFLSGCPQPPGPPVDLCEGANCDDGNPCTTEGCGAETGMCEYSIVADGTGCGVNMECQQGECLAVAGELAENPKERFATLYFAEEVSVTPQVPSYELPLDLGGISNYDDVSLRLGLENTELLEENGFMVVDHYKEDDIVEMYESIRDWDIPIFITSDSLLHLYHIQFDETLKSIEEREFFDDIKEISTAMLDYFEGQYEALSGDAKEAAKRNVTYYSVGLKLLDESAVVPDYVSETVDAELALIAEHKDLEESPLFIYKEDYSQYVPRGHYTRSETLKKYFKAMMWYGRIAFLLKGDDIIPVGTQCEFCDALISTYDAKIQTMQAVTIADAMDSVEANGEFVNSRWDRIYSVTAYYVGVADDLTPYEYNEAVEKVFESAFNISLLEDEGNMLDLKAELANLRMPKIYGGTGECQIYPPINPEQLNECLDKSKGLRFMGQRFVPDSYVFQNMVTPMVGPFIGEGEPFTMCQTEARKTRCWPRGLDVMAVMGSERAKEILESEGDTAYYEMINNKEVSYEKQFTEMKNMFDDFTEEEWNKNLYWSWLYTIKSLLRGYGEGYPTFMQNSAWQDKQLNAALSSWAELRHDTILYAKQPYTPVEKVSEPAQPPGYVEPVPEFYARMLSLARMTSAGLGEMNVLDETSKLRLESLENILERLVDISERELANEELSEDDYEFIRDFGARLESVITDVEDSGKETTLIADVHTDLNTKTALEEGVGYIKLVVVAYKVPSGEIVIGAGPVLSYYEFKQPIDDRLTDEAWKEMLENNEGPAAPEWTASFYAS